MRILSRLSTINLIIGMFIIVTMAFLFDSINTSRTYRQIDIATQKKLLEIDSPRRFTIIATDGICAIDYYNDKKYASYLELQSLGDAPAESVAVLFCIPETSAIDAIATAHSHFASIGVQNFYVEYAQKTKYQRISFDEGRKKRTFENELAIYGKEVLFSGKRYCLDEVFINALRKKCDSNNAPVDILCRGETQCGYLMTLIDMLNLKPYRELYLHIDSSFSGKTAVEELPPPSPTAFSSAPISSEPLP